jgi:nucleoside-diphosphate-sugar epimerase
MKKIVLVTGACGQIGSELVLGLKAVGYSVVATDLRKPLVPLEGADEFEVSDVLDAAQLSTIVSKYKPVQIYHLAALLSAMGEKNPDLAWEVNMKGLKNILDVAVQYKVSRVFYPSTIAIFGPNSPKQHTPQCTVTEPTTIYGISKLAGERWCAYYFQKHGLDVRSLRYPGLISYKTRAGGGTTDYAVDIFFDAVEKGSYSSFLSENTYLPMMYMPDAIRGTIELMETNAELLSQRAGYNFSAMSFSPKELGSEIKKYLPDFKVEYLPDFRQAIADSWPVSIDDSLAQIDWGWEARYDLATMTKDMLANIKSN